MDSAIATLSQTALPAVPAPAPAGAAAIPVQDRVFFEPAPKSFRELTLIFLWGVYVDLHVNLSGLAFFGLIGWGILHPDDQMACQQLSVAAGTYLFASAKKK